MKEDSDQDERFGELPRSLKKALAKLGERLETDKRSRIQKLASEGFSEDDVETLENEFQERQSNLTKRVTGRGSRRALEAAQLRLFELERAGRFVGSPVEAGEEFPAILTRLPIFVPSKGRAEGRQLDKDNAIVFESPWGKGRKFGPPLNIYDEDTLIALMRLRQMRLTGQGPNMPLPVPRSMRAETEEVEVYALCCLLSQVQEFCGVSKGGANRRLRLQSIKRLTATRIEFESKQPGEWVGHGTSVSLVEVHWQAFSNESVLYVQIPPAIASWLDHAYARIDWNVRRELTDTGKAVHRFLSGQRRHYKIKVKTLMDVLAYPREYKYFCLSLRRSLETLKNVGWLKDWGIEGNGRTAPHVLSTWRAGR